jgi:hypothetical protein
MTARKVTQTLRFGKNVCCCVDGVFAMGLLMRGNSSRGRQVVAVENLFHDDFCVNV